LSVNIGKFLLFQKRSQAVLFNFIKKFIMLILYTGLSFLAGAVLAFLLMKARASSLRVALQEEIAKLDKESGILQERLLISS
jgi:hypothetical protein